MCEHTRACIRASTTHLAGALPSAQLVLLLLSAVFVTLGEVASVKQSIKACEEELKGLPKGDPERVALQQQLAALRQELAALRQKEVLLLQQAQGWFLPSAAQILMPLVCNWPYLMLHMLCTCQLMVHSH